MLCECGLLWKWSKLQYVTPILSHLGDLAVSSAFIFLFSNSTASSFYSRENAKKEKKCSILSSGLLVFHLTWHVLKIGLFAQERCCTEEGKWSPCAKCSGAPLRGRYIVARDRLCLYKFLKEVTTVTAGSITWIIFNSSPILFHNSKVAPNNNCFYTDVLLE